MKCFVQLVQMRLLSDRARRAIGTGFILSLILTVMGVVLPVFWVNAFLVVVSWTIATIFAHIFVRKEHELTSYIMYMIGLLGASFLSEYFSQAILEAIGVASLSATDPKNVYYLAGSLVMAGCLYYDLHVELSTGAKRKAQLQTEEEQPTHENQD